MRIDHIAIAVRSLDEALATFREVWGMAPSSIEVAGFDKVREAMLPIGDTHLQLLEATDDQSTVAKFIERRGEGLHHIAIQVDDIDAELVRLKDAGARLVDEQPRQGGGGKRVAFVHPKASNGVLVEVIEGAD